MRKSLVLVPLATLLFIGAGCSNGSTTAVTPSAPAPAPAAMAPTTPPPAPAPAIPAHPPAPAQPVTSGPRLQVTLSGDGTDSGTYAANCGYAYPGEQKGAVFSASFNGYQLSIVDDTNRTAGAQSSAAGKWILNGPHNSYVSVEGVAVTFGPDMQWATVKGDFAAGLSQQGPKIHVDGRFDCK